MDIHKKNDRVAMEAINESKPLLRYKKTRLSV